MPEPKRDAATLAGGVIGWDIGGVHVKAARVADGQVVASASRPFAIQHELERLPDLLREMAAALGASEGTRHGVTMTAELSQRFATKAEGVFAIMDAVERAFPAASVRWLTSQGQFQPSTAARRDPIGLAAANWIATAIVVAIRVRHALVVDVGSTTTDLIPIVGHRNRVRGRTDPGRLAAGELLYLGAVRTPVEAIVHEVPLGYATACVSAEGFALSGDVWLWLGRLDPAAWTTPTPDGRGLDRDALATRLARVVCADRTMLDDEAIDRIARHVAEAQVSRTARAIEALHRRWPEIDRVLTAGVGGFIAAEAAAVAGLPAEPLAGVMGGDDRHVPAAAAALVLERAFGLGMT